MNLWQAMFHGEDDIGRPYGDDLRRKFFSGYDEGEGTLEELAERFLVSVGWVRRFPHSVPVP